MKFNEFLDKEGLVSVSDKTNISIEILLKLIDNDFEEITRVRALGFLSILRREYNIELSDLDDSIKKYFEEESHDDDSKPVLTPNKDRKEKDSGFFKWLIIFALLGGLWYLYSGGKLGGNLSNNTTKENLLNDSDILKSTTTDNNAKYSVIIKEDENKTEVEITTLKGNLTIEDTIVEKSEVNISIEVESNKTVESNESKIKEHEDINNSSADIENSLDENIQETIEATEDSVEISEDSVIVDDDEIAEIIYNVTVNPRVNLWFGFINIDTKERKEFMTTDSTSMDVGEQRWILMTGHGRLSVSSGSRTHELSDRIKHYFYIDSSEIKEITRKEFKKYNGGRGW